MAALCLPRASTLRPRPVLATFPDVVTAAARSSYPSPQAACSDGMGHAFPLRQGGDRRLDVPRAACIASAIFWASASSACGARPAHVPPCPPAWRKRIPAWAGSRRYRRRENARRRSDAAGTAQGGARSPLRCWAAGQLGSLAGLGGVFGISPLATCHR
jgi:hypothetical protein